MNKFKVGDRVVVVNPANSVYGKEGIIITINPLSWCDKEHYTMRYDGFKNDFYATSLELVAPLVTNSLYK